MTRPYLSQFPTVAEFRIAFDAWHDDAHSFANKVDARVEEQYDLQDGGDLCYNLIDNNTIDMTRGVDEAARIVAMHIRQA